LANFITYFLKPVWCLGYIMNNLYASLTLDGVKKLVCLKAGASSQC